MPNWPPPLPAQELPAFQVHEVIGTGARGPRATHAMSIDLQGGSTERATQRGPHELRAATGLSVSDAKRPSLGRERMENISPSCGRATGRFTLR